MNPSGQSSQHADLGDFVMQPNGGNDAQAQEPWFWYYLWLIRRRAWMFVVLPIVCLVVTFFSTMGERPTYKASTRLLVAKASYNSDIGRKGDVVGWGGDDRFLNTQFTIMRSRPLARSVIEQLDLVRSPELVGKPEDKKKGVVDRLKRWIVAIIPSSKAAAAPEQAAAQPAPAPKPVALVDAFLNRVEVEPVPGTRLVDLSFSGSDPEAISHIVNALAQIYIEQELKRDMASVEQILGYLREQQAEYQKRVEQSEEELLIYKRDMHLVAMESRGEILKEKLAALTGALASARIYRIRCESRYQSIKDSKVEMGEIVGLGHFTDNDRIKELGRDYMRLKYKEAQYAKKFGPKHYKMKALEAQKAEAEAMLACEMQLAIEEAKTDLAKAKAEEASLQKVLEGQKRETLGVEEKIIRFNVLKREARGNEMLFNFLLQKAKETSLAGAILQKNIKIISRAEPPTSAEPTKRGRHLAMSFVLGLMAAAGLAFFLEHLDNSVKGADDLERHIGLSFLGSVGHIGEGIVLDERALPLVVVQQPKSSLAESFRALRTNLMFSAREADRRNLVVTSAVAKEGKSTVAANLAYVIAQSGKRVLLVGADMRRPAIGRTFGIKEGNGLSSYLVGEASLGEVVYPSSLDNLSIIPCGTLPTNQSELLGSEAMLRLIEWASENYDIAIYDSPPVASVSDPLVLGAVVGAAIFVVRVGDTSRPIVQRCVQQMRDLDIHLLGGVMNDIDQKATHYYHYYSYPYYYRYYRRRDDEYMSGDEGAPDAEPIKET